MGLVGLLGVDVVEDPYVVYGFDDSVNTAVVLILKLAGQGVDFIGNEANGLAQDTSSGILGVGSGNKAKQHLLGLAISLQHPNGLVRILAGTEYAISAGIDLAVAFEPGAKITH